MVRELEADFVIVGAGSAGCAMAFRLSEAGASVLVVEYGGSDSGPLIQMPAALSYPMNMKRYDWGFQSEPEPNLGGRRLACPRGKVLGGSSSINGMVYVRGHARDYDTWAEMGAYGWSFADVLPYFRRMENWHGRDGDSEWRGTDGPLHVSRGPRENPLVQAFVKAGQQAGYPVTRDYNGCQQEGFGAMEATIWNGRRWSAANAYLRPALKRDGCRLVKGLAERIVIQDGRAIGVRISQGARSMTVNAHREVIIAASAINSPKLLMLSGIGPSADLVAHGIHVVADRPGVGRNLQDHLEVLIQMRATQPVSLYNHWSLLGKGAIGARWLLTGRGIGASNHFENCGFIRSRAGIEYPDIEFHFLPIAIRYDGKTSVGGHGFQAHVGPTRSKSRGSVTLRSADPQDAPAIRFSYMSHPDDWKEFRACIRLTRELFAQEAFSHFAGEEILPGSGVQGDDEIDAMVRDNAESSYHPCGTARMGGRDDPMAVVDPECRVIGVDRLRLADSSVFPQIPNGNLNGPTIMLGEKAADHILGRDPLPPQNLEPWIHPDWRTAQR